MGASWKLDDQFFLFVNAMVKFIIDRTPLINQN